MYIFGGQIYNLPTARLTSSSNKKSNWKPKKKLQKHGEILDLPKFFGGINKVIRQSVHACVNASVRVRAVADGEIPQNCRSLIKRRSV